MDRRWSANRVRAARVFALLADAAQIGLFPLSAEGAASPLDAALDVVVCAVMTWLLGWHWLFLPTFVAEAVPALALVPSWTAAVLVVTRRSRPGMAAPSDEGARPP